MEDHIIVHQVPNPPCYCTSIEDEEFYLEHPCAATIVNTPVSYFTITITRTDEIFFIRMEVKWHYTSRMPSESPKWVARLQIITGYIRKTSRRTIKMVFVLLFLFGHLCNCTMILLEMFINATLPQPLP